MKMRKRWYYKFYHTAETDVLAFDWLKDIKEKEMDYWFYDFDYYTNTPIPKALSYYFFIRSVLEGHGKAQELDEAFGKILPDDYKDMPYDSRFGFYTTVSDSEDIVQIMAPTIIVDKNIIRPSVIPKFCQPLALRYIGFPAWLNIPPSAIWLSERVLKQNEQMKDVKVEVI